MRGADRLREHLREGGVFLRWVLYACVIGVAVGLAAVAFLLEVDWATGLRGRHPWLVFLLPLAGVVIVLLYRACGMEKDRGTDLVLVAVREAGPLRLRTAPLIFAATALTHLCGAPPAGRGPLSSWVAPWPPGPGAASAWTRRTSASWSCAAWPPPSPPCSARR